METKKYVMSMNRKEAKEILKDRLRLNSNSEAVETFRKLAESECPTAIHIRLGDYLEITELNVISKGYFEEAVNILEQKSQTTKYWIFTNDEDNCQNYLPTSISSRIRLIPHELSSCETLEIMRFCHNYIISNSTFSWWGAFLSRNEDVTVIAPKNWFRSHTEPFQICPEDWIRI